MTGNPGKRPIPSEAFVEGAPIKPAWLDGRAAEIWAEVVAFAYWLTVADSYTLAAWCDQQAAFEQPRKRASWRASDRREHQACASDLGLDPANRARLVGL